MQHEPEGRLLDNAVAESFFASLKREMEGIDDLESWEAATFPLGVHEGFYNPCRRHSALITTARSNSS